MEEFSGCGSTTCFNYSAIVTAELWTERIMLYYVDTAPGAWGHPNGVQSIVVDTGVGQCFEAHWADLNNDGQVGFSDLSLILSAWEASDAGDANGDGVTNFSDISVVLSEWGSDC